jgi:hypothetical protein
VGWVCTASIRSLTRPAVAAFTAQAGRNTARITGVVISATGNERTKQVHECTNGEVVVPRPVVAPKAATPASFTKETRPAGANKGKPPGAAPQPKDEIWAK